MIHPLLVITSPSSCGSWIGEVFGQLPEFRDCAREDTCPSPDCERSRLSDLIRLKADETKIFIGGPRCARQSELAERHDR